MALIYCTECNHTISDHALMCPDCGYSSNDLLVSSEVVKPPFVMPEMTRLIIERDNEKSKLIASIEANLRNLFWMHLGVLFYFITQMLMDVTGFKL